MHSDSDTDIHTRSDTDTRAKRDARAESRVDAFDSAVHFLLSCTERLREAVVEGLDAELLAAAFAARETAFESLRALASPAVEVRAAARSGLARIRALDAEMMALGATLTDAIRGEQHALHRRKSAIQAHASRAREQPRLVTVKA